MSTLQKSVIDGQLATKAIRRWKIDPAIRQRFALVSDFYAYLAAQDTRQKAWDEWEKSAEIRRRYKTFNDYLVSQFATPAD